MKWSAKTCQHPEFNELMLKMAMEDSQLKKREIPEAIRMSSEWEYQIYES